LEFDESFIIVAYPPSLPGGHNNCYTKVYIEDDNGKLVIKFLVVHKLPTKVMHSIHIHTVTSSYVATYVCNYVY